MRIQSGRQAVGTLVKNHKNIGFLRNTGLAPLKNHKATKPMLGHYRQPAKWHLNGPLIVVFGSSLPQRTKNIGLPLAKLSGSAHENHLKGYRLTFFRQEQAWPLKQNGWGLSPKLRGPGFGRKLNSFQYHCQAFVLLKFMK